MVWANSLTVFDLKMQSEAAYNEVRKRTFDDAHKSDKLLIDKDFKLQLKAGEQELMSLKMSRALTLAAS